MDENKVIEIKNSQKELMSALVDKFEEISKRFNFTEKDRWLYQARFTNLLFTKQYEGPYLKAFNEYLKYEKSTEPTSGS